MAFLNPLEAIACNVGEWARRDGTACMRHPRARAQAPLPRGRETERRDWWAGILSAERCGPIGRTLALPRRQGPGVQGMRMAREGKSCYPRSEGYRQASTDSVYQTSADMQNLTLFFTRKKFVGVSRATREGVAEP